MTIIEPTDMNFSKIIEPLDKKTIERLTKEALEIDINADSWYLYSKFYNSKYKVVDLTSQEENLRFHTQNLLNKYGNIIRTSNQGIEYEWIMINFDKIGDIAYRFYLAPNPKNMHEIVKKLSSEFVCKNIPVAFKYQKKFKMTQCDRIIIYSDYNNKMKIEECILNVYNDNPKLFDGSERALPWLYNSLVPNVYFTPETKGTSYGERFAETILQAKFIFNYLYGITSLKSNITLDLNKTTEYMNLIISSLLFRNGLLLLKDGRKNITKDAIIKTTYDYNTGILTNYTLNSNNAIEVNFFPTLKGRKALIKNFYNIYQIKQQDGLKIKKLSFEQKRELNEKNYIKF